MSSTYAVGPVVGPHLAARPEAAALAVGQPQHQVGEGQVGDDLPVRLEQLQPGDVLVVEVGVAAHELGQGRHGHSVGRQGAPHPRRRTRARGWQDGRHVRVVLEAGARATASQVPTDRPLDDLTAELTRMLGSTDPGAARRHRLPRAGHLDRPRRLRRPARRPRRRDGRRPGRRPRRERHRLGLPAQLLACWSSASASPATPPQHLLPGRQGAASGATGSSTWFLRERDLRGYVPGKGWAHAIAHGADAIGALAGSPPLRRRPS